MPSSGPLRRPLGDTQQVGSDLVHGTVTPDGVEHTGLLVVVDHLVHRRQLTGEPGADGLGPVVRTLLEPGAVDVAYARHLGRPGGEVVDVLLGARAHPTASQSL